jgi:GT2 family glycosyltransferase
LSGSAAHRVTRLTVVIPATNAPETLDRCIAAIAYADDAPDEVIIVKEPRNASPAWARNRGADRASHEIIVFVDADVEVSRDAFRRIREAFDALPGLTAVFGSYDDSPEDPGVVSSFRNLLHHHVHQQGGGPVATFWAGLGAVRREAFLEAKGFDERRFPHPSVEDIELGMRLTAAGKMIRLDPAIQGRHLKRWTFGSMVHADLTRRGIPWTRLLLERGPGSAALNLSWRHRTSALASVTFLAGLAGRRPAVAASSLSVILWLNRSFYLLLARRGGPRLAAAGVGLHVTHHLVSAVAVPLAMVGHLGRRRRSRPSSE